MPFPDVPAIAVTADGMCLYGVGKTFAGSPGQLFRLELDTLSYYFIDTITYSTNQLAFSPDGKLYFGNYSNDSLYRIENYDSSPTVHLVGAMMYGSLKLGVGGADMTYYEGSEYAALFWGDMSVGPLIECTRTIGYWKNHSWEGQTVTICEMEITEDGSGDTINGMDILWSARGNTYSMLFAQLIAAKLNANGAFGIDAIENAEDYICTELGMMTWINYLDERIGKKDKQIVSSLAEALDYFNNSFPCDDEEE